MGRIRQTMGERLWRAILGGALVVLSLACLYPFLYVLSMSISAPYEVLNKTIILLPKGFSLESYKLLLHNRSIWQAYYNTLWYTVVGTGVSILLSVLIAYPLSRSSFFMRKPIMFFVTVTMFFGGGMIPLFILVSQIHLYNTRWAIVLPAAISTWNVIIARTFFQSIPESLSESARIDGANDLRILASVVLPLSMPILAVLTLFYAVGQWNSYFPALLFLPSPDLHPMQLFLMRVLIQMRQELATALQIGINRAVQAEQLKFSAIIVTVLPILCVYPLLQKYFVKGVMLGALKG
jgi:putative aldouronate transport system permease protein